MVKSAGVLRIAAVGLSLVVRLAVRLHGRVRKAETSSGPREVAPIMNCKHIRERGPSGNWGWHLTAAAAAGSGFLGATRVVPRSSGPVSATEPPTVGSSNSPREDVLGSALLGNFFTQGYLVGHWPALRAGAWAIQLHYGEIIQCSEEPWQGSR